MSIDTLTADANVRRAAPRNWEAPIPNGVAENEPPDTGEVDMSFWDFVDIINPLQHIPVVGSVYRELTGDSIKGVSRVIGGGLYGSIVGMVAAIGSAIVEDATGKDPGGHLIALFKDDESETPAVQPTAVAQAPAVPTAPVPAAPAQAAPAQVAMAEPATAGDVLMPAAAPATAATAPSLAMPSRPADPHAKFFPVPGRVAGLQPKSLPPVPTGPGAMLERMPRQNAASQLASTQAAARPQGQGQGQGQTADASWPPGGPAQVPQALVADMMMNALDKYKQGARTGTSSVPPAGGSVRNTF